MADSRSGIVDVGEGVRFVLLSDMRESGWFEGFRLYMQSTC